MTRKELRKVDAENGRRRKQAIADRREVIRSLWPTTTVREIAMMLDMTPDAVNANAVKIGLERRPATRQP